MENKQLRTLLRQEQDCYRCQSSPAIFYCSDCHNGFFCDNCDHHVHLLSTKLRHKRSPIMNGVNPANRSLYCSMTKRAVSLLNTSQSKTYQRSSSMLDIMNNTTVDPKSSPCCIKEMNKINEEEKEELLRTISHLNKKLSETTSALNARIECLHTQMDDLTQRHLEEMNETKHRQCAYYDDILLEKEDRINFLYDKVYALEELSSRQKNKIEQYEEQLQNSQSNYRDRIALANCHLEELVNENKMIKEFYEKKIGEITNISAEEKNRVENNYEKAIETLKVGYETGKQKHLGIIQQKEKEIKELTAKHQKEKSEMTEVNDKLKETNDKTLREKIELIKANNGLKKSFDDANAAITDLKKDVKGHMKKERQLDEEIEKMRADNENLQSKSEKLNHMLFGRFKRKKTSIEQ